MTVKKLIGKLHLWLGLSSGLLVVIIALTGCIYAFQQEIQDLAQPYRFVELQHGPFLPPSQLRHIADEQLPGKKIHAVLYQGRERAAKAIYYSSEEAYYMFVYLNPYSGEVLKITDENNTFFGFILDGHFYLWLPSEIGQPVVASATMVFLVMIVTGLFLWWPRNKSGRRQRFTLKWNARWRRKNYDLHNVMGFYISWLALIFAITGLVWGFEWFRHSYYAAISGGNTIIEYEEPLSEKTGFMERTNAGATAAVDKVWRIMNAEHPLSGATEIHFPEDTLSCIAANSNPDPGTYWQTDYRYFDQYTLKEIPVKHQWGRMKEASGADKLMRMNYDIHVGSILGFSGKVLAFLVSLIIASLPVTGFLIWWGRKNKAKPVQGK